jgi:hypothetical protein
LVAAPTPDRLGKLGYGQLAVDGLIGWSALVAHARRQRPAVDPRPNTKSWQHVGDLEALSEQLGVALA